jgi:hypothetical protein
MSVIGCSNRRRTVGAVGLATLFVLASCSVEQTLPPPNCFTNGTGLIVAQSVRSASQVPCLLDLPTGWAVATVQVNEHHSVITLDSDRAGDGAAVLRLEEACDVTDAVSAPSDLIALGEDLDIDIEDNEELEKLFDSIESEAPPKPAERFDLIERVQPSFRAERFYVFPGGCVSWTFDFDEGTSATESVSIGNALALMSRQKLQDNVREGFIDEEI